MKRNITLSICLLPAFYFAQVGINTQVPDATLHVKSQNTASTDKTFYVQNGKVSDSNNLEVYGDNRTYIGKPDNQTPDAVNDALLNLYGESSRSNLRLINPPSTENQSDGKVRPGVNYNKLAPLYIDANGHIVKAYDPSSPTALSFDGNYTVPNNSTE